MRLKHSLLIFVLGILIGMGISPLAKVKPYQPFLSPIPLTLAEEVMWEDVGANQILGARTADQEIERQENISGLVNQQDQDLSQANLYLVSQPPSTQSNHKSVTSSKVTVAIFGDSMVDTMGTGLPYLKSVLSQYYPQVQFNLLNYGIGAQNIESGLSRFGETHSYQDRNYPAITSSGANIIIIESFAYNPPAGGEAGLDTQWQTLSQMVNKAAAAGAKVMILATIAPSRTQFGQGPGGISWTRDEAWQQAELINKYLANAVRLSNTLKVPVVDAYHVSLLSDGEGNPVFINSNDHIHPSVAGHQFVAGLIAQKIFDLDLIK